ncbi:MAG TPA: hypothetical protein VGL99_21145 [Chloroflexota bacterium]|jgi:hypothetical protein
MPFLRRSVAVLVVFGALAGAASLSAARADDALNAQLQQIIQRNNDEQVQAITLGNAAVTTDIRTDDYARQVTGILRDMLDSKVFEIGLMQVSWGPISVAGDGKSATVTTYEAWRISSREGGSIDYDQVRNDYALVLDNTTWKIKSVVQIAGTVPPTSTPGTPTSTPSPSPTSTPSPTPTPQPTVTPTPLPEPVVEERLPMLDDPTGDNPPGEETMPAPGEPPPAQ